MIMFVIGIFLKQIFGFIIFIITSVSSSFVTTSEQASPKEWDDFSIEAMIQNYEENAEGIMEVLDYASKAINDYCGLQLVINESGISKFYIYNFMWMGTDRPKQADLDKLMPFVELTNEELDTIIAKLKKVNCLSVEFQKSETSIGGYAKVLYWENKKDSYYYHIFYDQQCRTFVEKSLEDMERFLPYNNTMFLEYNPKSKFAHRAIFPNKEQYLKELNLPKAE